MNLQTHDESTIELAVKLRQMAIGSAEERAAVKELCKNDPVAFLMAGGHAGWSGASFRGVYATIHPVVFAAEDPPRCSRVREDWTRCGVGKIERDGCVMATSITILVGLAVSWLVGFTVLANRRPC